MTTTATEAGQLRQIELETWRQALAEDTWLDPIVWEVLHELGEITDDKGEAGLVTVSHELLAEVVGIPTDILRHCLWVGALEGWLLLADDGGDRAVYRLTDPRPLPLELDEDDENTDEEHHEGAPDDREDEDR